MSKTTILHLAWRLTQSLTWQLSSRRGAQYLSSYHNSKRRLCCLCASNITKQSKESPALFASYREYTTENQKGSTSADSTERQEEISRENNSELIAEQVEVKQCNSKQLSQHSENSSEEASVNYEYFRNLMKLKDVKNDRITHVPCSSSADAETGHDTIVDSHSFKMADLSTQSQITEEEDSEAVSSADDDSSDSNDVVAIHKPVSTIQPSFNLAAYVNKSECLANFIKLGVDFSEVEKITGAADLFVQLDFDKDVQPYLLFLHDIGVPDDQMGDVISKNPLIFKEHLDDLQVRIKYLKSKKFSAEAIAGIVTKAPLALLMSTEKLDSKLGFLQEDFKLTGQEVREVVTKLPKLIIWHRQKLKDNKFYMKEFLGFSDSELKEILLKSPKIYLTNKYSVGKKFDFLYNVVGIKHDRLTQWPHIFRSRLHLINQRHRFLLSVGRAQYDPTKENYVSLKALVSRKDKDFCQLVAKTSVVQFNNFLKTL